MTYIYANVIQYRETSRLIHCVILALLELSLTVHSSTGIEMTQIQQSIETNPVAYRASIH